MKPTDTYWEVNKEGEIVCVYHGDQQRRTIAVRSTNFPMSPYQVASLMNNSFESGVRAKTEQIRRELGL